ncbi:hypothetical protein [Dyadobacter sp. CY323]|uniref:hypothetical protein n=1 Tax=Dyadobacter sp. CY323 TaxID=2907302 RepID=UPI001F2FC0D7|nr:hypothetical protein [Dyadobacter sp. CY323]MCE6990162.1 hypothetical protein [Dyadobacter sp. CY323]
MNKCRILFLLTLLALAASGFRSDQPGRYFLSPTLSLPADHVQAFTFDFKDELLDDTLFQTRSKEGFPLSYHRRLKTSVCFDDKCRLLDVAIYWNITGRYLGFELPQKEYLSKTDHEPFTTDEYQRLNALLADEQSPLGNMSYEELVPRPYFTVKGIDGVTSATAKSVLDYIVKGAAYTTYKMWHFIYGPTQERVTELTIKSLSPELIMKILESGDAYDKLWALNHINGHVKPTPQILGQLLRFIDNRNYSLSERAINAISPTDLQSDSVQVLLLSKLNQADYSQKKLLIKKLKEAPFLNADVKTNLADQLPKLSAELVGDVLVLFQKFGVKDLPTYRAVSQLLRSENRFIGSKALKFLQDAGVTDEAISREMAAFRTSQ